MTSLKTNKGVADQDTNGAKKKSTLPSNTAELPAPDPSNPFHFPQFAIPTGLRFNGVPTGLRFNGVPTGLRFNGVPTGLRFNGVPTGLRFNGVPTGLRFNGVPTGLRFNGVPIMKFPVTDAPLTHCQKMYDLPMREDDIIITAYPKCGEFCASSRKSHADYHQSSRYALDFCKLQCIILNTAMNEVVIVLLFFVSFFFFLGYCKVTVFILWML